MPHANPRGEREYLAILLSSTAAAQTALGRHREALATLTSAHAEALARLGPGHLELALLDLEVGAAMLATGERVAGLARATDGLARVLAADDVSPEQALAARARMAELVTLAGRTRAPAAGRPQ